MHKPLVALIFCIAANRVSAVQYEVDGTITQSITNPIRVMPDTPVLVAAGPKMKCDFTVFVSDCAWLVQLRGVGRTNAAQEVGSTSGTDIFQVGYGSVRGANGAAQRVSMAQVYSGGAPVDFTELGVIGHLWLMFASGCHLQGITNHMLTPVWNITAAAPGAPDLKAEAYWELINGPGSTPWSVRYLQTPPLIPRITNGIYQATGKTNVGGVIIASGLIFEHRELWRVHRRADCTVTAVRPFCSRTDLLPVPTGITSLGDFRIKMPKEGSNPPPLVVTMYDTNKGWLPPEQAKKEFLDNHARLAAAVHRKKVTPLELVGLAALLLAPTAWFVFRPRSKAGSARNKRK